MIPTRWSACCGRFSSSIGGLLSQFCPAPRGAACRAAASPASSTRRPASSPRRRPQAARQATAVHILKRGDIHKPGLLAVPGSLACLPSFPARFAARRPEERRRRRAALARWLSDPRNPLTYRSIVNRLWQYHFGRGIVDTPSDFGRMGSIPSIPSCSTGWPRGSWPRGAR